jgi:hypothetical protein
MHTLLQSHPRTQYSNSTHLPSSPLAENYGWFFAYYYFDSIWQWDTTPPHDEFKKADENLNPFDHELTTEEINMPIPEPSFPLNEDEVPLSTQEAPISCHQIAQNDGYGNQVVECDFIGGDYGEWVAESTQPFQSEGGCELS